MKHFYTFCLFTLLLLANMSLLAQIPQDTFFNEGLQFFSPYHIKQSNQSSAKTIDEENILLAYNLDLNYSDIWFSVDSITYYYNDDNQLIAEENMRLNNGVLLNYYKFIYEYDSNENLIYKETKNWEDSTWVNSLRFFYTYDSNGVLTIENRDRYDNEAWRYSRETTYEYNSLNNLEYSLVQYKSIPNDWNDYKQTFYEYDFGDNIISELSQKKSNNNWRNDTIIIYEYDANNNQTLKSIQKWIDGSWTNIEKQNFEYDENNNLITQYELDWYEDNWRNLYNRQNIYNKNEDLIKTNIYAWENDDWELEARILNETKDKRQIVSYQSWQNNSWITEYRQIYYYAKEFPVYVPSTSPSTDLYPNPSTGEFTISLNDKEIISGLLEIFNSNGQLVYFQNIEFAIDKLSLDLAGLSDGIYYLMLSDDNTKIKQTLMLVR